MQSFPSFHRAADPPVLARSLCQASGSGAKNPVSGDDDDLPHRIPLGDPFEGSRQIVEARDRRRACADLTMRHQIAEMSEHVVERSTVVGARVHADDRAVGPQHVASAGISRLAAGEADCEQSSFVGDARNRIDRGGAADRVVDQIGTVAAGDLSQPITDGLVAMVDGVLRPDARQ